MITLTLDIDDQITIRQHLIMIKYFFIKRCSVIRCKDILSTFNEV